jgi:hypothetical protein
MHDPMTVAFEIRYPWRAYRNAKSEFERTYRHPFITIWHNDPQRDGSDDSCGWFKRARHGDKSTLEKIKKAFASDWDGEYLGWFEVEGKPRFSVSAITLGLFHRAAYIHFGKNHRAAKKFLRERLYDILFFAENPVDSFHPAITLKYGPRKREERIAEAASIVYGCILRWTQPWYRHARWHVWHWRFQVHPWQTFRRWLLTRCARCGKRFAWGESPVSHSWDSPRKRFLRGEVGLYHSECSVTHVGPNTHT